MRVAGIFILFMVLILILVPGPKKRPIEKHFKGNYIPDLGVSNSWGDPTKTDEIYSFKKVKIRRGNTNCLTTEELLNNIEDAEMRGMDDDPATLEDLYWELK